MLALAERTCRDAGTPRLTLSTSELQQAALAFYRKPGYRLVREENAAAQTNKTVGGTSGGITSRSSLLSEAWQLFDPLSALLAWASRPAMQSDCAGRAARRCACVTALFRFPVETSLLMIFSKPRLRCCNWRTRGRSLTAS